jgi:hypothetical protein
MVLSQYLPRGMMQQDFGHILLITYYDYLNFFHHLLINADGSHELILCILNGAHSIEKIQMRKKDNNEW